MEYRPSEELDGLPLESAENERLRAKAWMDSAAQFGRNAAYWEKRCRQAEAGEGGRRTPVQGNRRIPVGGPGHGPGTVAWWEHLQAWQDYAKRYGREQTAARLADRGGFCYLELTDHLGHPPTTWQPWID